MIFLTNLYVPRKGRVNKSEKHPIPSTSSLTVGKDSILSIKRKREANSFLVKSLYFLNSKMFHPS